MKKHTLTLVLMMVSIALTVPATATTATITDTIANVTVYRGQALVTRTIKSDLPAGTSELIVGNLPAKIVPESLYAQTSGHIKVLSVRYREKAVKEDSREEVKKLDAEIEKVATQLRHAEGDRCHNSHQWGRMFCKLHDPFP